MATVSKNKYKTTYSSKKSIATVPLEYIREAILWDEETGEFFWRERPLNHFTSQYEADKRNARYAGKKAGRMNCGHYEIPIFWQGNCYWIRGSYLAWYLSGRTLAEGKELDHRDRNPSNNRIDNLRECTHAENSRNRIWKKLPKVTGTPGVYYDERKGIKQRWYSKITINYKQINLGRFDTMEEAVAARKKAEEEHFGEFAPTFVPDLPPSGLTPEEEQWVNSIGNL